MASIEESIETALFTRVTSLSLSGSPSIAWPNFSAEPAKPYIRVDHLRNDTTRLFAKGSDPHRRQGILRLTVVAPLNDGPANALALAGAIAAHFPAQLTLHKDGVRVTVQKAPYVGPVVRQDASSDLQVSVSYQCFA